MIGTTLAHYRVTAALGAGGMGEVWKAEDEKLGREVALKLLPADFAEDPERMARFEREAKVLASFNHPNIATLYGLESVSGTETETGTETVFLAMELVEGEDLSERIQRGSVPVEEAVAIALQIAEALEAAHEQGIVHRDLKPANIKLRPDGTVKVLDFGLAKAWDAESNDSSVSMSPTLTAHATAAGVIIGTAAYMSPEQAAGVAADQRADIWAFGVVLWEMLTGHKLFDGETVSHVLASVLKDEVDLDELPVQTPRRLRDLISRCLRKKPKQRLQAIGDARIVLEEPMEDDVPAAKGPREVSSSRSSKIFARLGWALGVLGLGAAAVLLWMLTVGEPGRVYQTSIRPPENSAFYLAGINPGAATISPDGTKIAFSARGEDGAVRLFLRALDQPQAHVMSGTEGAQFPFWSPDSRWVGFVTQHDGTLKKIEAAGGPPITICSAGNGKGGSWGADGEIVFAPDAGAPLHRVSASGGESQPITEIDRDLHNSHRHPRFLPDGKHFLFLARGTKATESAVMVGSLDGAADRELMRNMSQAEYAAGHLFFTRENTLLARPFDVQTMEITGEAKFVAENALTIPAAALGVFSVSPAGSLTYYEGKIDAVVVPRWNDRSGREIERLGDPGAYSTVALSPDDRSAAFTMTPINGTVDIWIYDLIRDLRTRFTFDDSTDFMPLWAPDGESVAFASNRDGAMNVYRMGIGGVEAAEILVESDQDVMPRGWSPDGRWLLYQKQAEETKSDIWALDLEGSGEHRKVRAQSSTEVPGSVSPDGRWLSYFSSESGGFEVYVTPFPEAGRRWQASTDGGALPFWCEGGRELVYQRMDGRLMSVEVELGADSVRFGETTELFDAPSPNASGPSFAPSADCQRFLVIPRFATSVTTPLNLMVGWPQVLEDNS